MIQNKQNLIGMNIGHMEKLVLQMGESRFRANQLYNWIYARGEVSIDNMANLSKTFKQKLSEDFNVERPTIVKTETSKDGTIKWLIGFDGCLKAEMVFIPSDDRGTLCISSQIGCTLTCKFCHTGTQPLVKNLSSSEIVGQVMLARDELCDWGGAGIKRKLTNIVFMGMGEPLFNCHNVIVALKLITHNGGLGFSRRKVTVSTSGVVPEIVKLANCGVGAMLSVSLHAPNDSIRNSIMPINKKYNLKQLLAVLKDYPKLSNTHRITWQYVMLDNINCEIHHAKELVELIKDIPSKVNIIPFNPWNNVDGTASGFKAPSYDKIKAFAQIILDRGIPAMVRKTKGDDIMAACGQLKTESEKIPNWKMRIEKKLTENQ